MRGSESGNMSNEVKTLPSRSNCEYDFGMVGYFEDANIVDLDTQSTMHSESCKKKLVSDS